eukprot:2087911-Amphidinium_carterae.1
MACGVSTFYERKHNFVRTNMCANMWLLLAKCQSWFKLSKVKASKKGSEHPLSFNNLDNEQGVPRSGSPYAHVAPCLLAGVATPSLVGLRRAALPSGQVLCASLRSRPSANANSASCQCHAHLCHLCSSCVIDLLHLDRKLAQTRVNCFQKLVHRLVEFVRLLVLSFTHDLLSCSGCVNRNLL